MQQGICPEKGRLLLLPFKQLKSKQTSYNHKARPQQGLIVMSN